MGNSDAPQKLIPPQLLTEALGFSPQLLLDDIINVANLAVQDGVNGTEDFLQQRAAQLGEMDGTQEIEQGLVAFQTLLEFHTDVAFDFFEAWSLRNIFAVPADLPLVLPHHEHLDPTHTPEREQELIDEVEKLRNQLENQRKLKRQLIRANHRKNMELVKAQELFNSLAAYEAMDAAKALPTALLASRSGETPVGDGQTGYINWAISQLLVKAKEDGGDELLPDVANAEMFRRASAAMDEVTRDLDGVEDVAMED
ncbi:Mis12 protein-domain-containing protein [Mycena metata]|uniref:Mis12 protein-domain-containing protein n=1 Tax=Mycena metata TaxID=1033252 RepID=A0AAD7GTS1_9AGAR|nr:Mis12 protein-domain-containing protein [Mycena metata]